MSFSVTIPTITFNYRGEHVRGTSYNINDIVVEGNSSYRSEIDNNTTIPSPTATDWEIFVAGNNVFGEIIEGGQSLQIYNGTLLEDLVPSDPQDDQFYTLNPETLEFQLDPGHPSVFVEEYAPQYNMPNNLEVAGRPVTFMQRAAGLSSVLDQNAESVIESAIYPHLTDSYTREGEFIGDPIFAHGFFKYNEDTRLIQTDDIHDEIVDTFSTTSSINIGVRTYRYSNILDTAGHASRWGDIYDIVANNTLTTTEGISYGLPQAHRIVGSSWVPPVVGDNREYSAIGLDMSPSITLVRSYPTSSSIVPQSIAAIDATSMRAQRTNGRINFYRILGDLTVSSTPLLSVEGGVVLTTGRDDWGVAIEGSNWASPLNQRNSFSYAPLVAGDRPRVISSTFNDGTDTGVTSQATRNSPTTSIMGNYYAVGYQLSSAVQAIFSTSHKPRADIRWRWTNHIPALNLGTISTGVQGSNRLECPIYDENISLAITHSQISQNHSFAAASTALTP